MTNSTHKTCLGSARTVRVHIFAFIRSICEQERSFLQSSSTFNAIAHCPETAPIAGWICACSLLALTNKSAVICTTKSYKKQWICNSPSYSTTLKVKFPLFLPAVRAVKPSGIFKLDQKRWYFENHIPVRAMDTCEPLRPSQQAMTLCVRLKWREEEGSVITSDA